jgi:hypothetical protein
MADPRWLRGSAWGTPRPGHPEGAVAAHVADVLANLDRQRLAPATRRKLRLVAILHDALKAEVDRARPPAGGNHHAVRARRFAEAYVDDPDVLELVELHDEAYNAWLAGSRRGRWDRAGARGRALLERLGPRLELFLAFFRADNATGDKRPDPVGWFERLARDTPP